MQKLFSKVVIILAALPGFSLCDEPPLSTSLLAPEATDYYAEDPVEMDSQCADAGWLCGPSRFWVSGEFLQWQTKDAQVPVLITTGVPGATTLPGVLGQAGTSPLFGGEDLDYETHSGGRFSAGFWLNNCEKRFGVEASYFFLAPRSVRFDDNSAVIARPFFDVISGVQNAQIVAFPGIATGDIQLRSSSRLQGAELNLLFIPCKPCCDPCAGSACELETGACGSGRNRSISLLGGFRYLQLDEDIGITENTQVNPALPAGPPLFGGSAISVSDQFDTENYFYGPQIGAKAEICYGLLFVDVLGKVAIGATQQVVDVRGSTSITPPGGGAAVTPVGFLASGSNSGRVTRHSFAVVPEVGINVGAQVTRHMRAFVGYTFLYCSSVVRPGDQIDTGLSGTQIPTDSRFDPAAGPERPSARNRDTDFWAQGINFGLEFRL